MRKIITLFAFTAVSLFFCSVSSYAQKKDTSKNGTTVIIFSNNVAQPGESHVKKNVDVHNIIKLNIISFLAGYEQVYYEYVINNNFSIEGGLGLTFHNYFEDIGYTLGTVNIDDSARTDGYADKYETHSAPDQHKSNIGFCLTVAPRVYPNGEGPEGFFIQPHFQYKLYTFSGLMADTGYTSNASPTFTNGKTFPETRRQFDFSVDFGYHIVNEHVSVELLGGVGLRDLSEVRNNIGEIQTNTYPTYNDFFNHTLVFNETLPLIILEVNVGYLF